MCSKTIDYLHPRVYKHITVYFAYSPVKLGSQYDTKAVHREHCEHHEKRILHLSNSIPDVKFFDNLIGWTLANAGDTTLK